MDDIGSPHSSQTSSLGAAVLKKLNCAWVQCEKPECLKWRRISEEEAEALGEGAPWFCRLNSDPDHNSCEAAEENYAYEERVARRYGLRYVMSSLPEGSLVWAKIQGYCKWPGLVSADPVCGDHCSIDVDGEALAYHIEFLGQHRSHSWVSARQVELYGQAAWQDCQVQPTEASYSSSNGAKLKKCRKRKRLLNSCSLKSSNRHSYRCNPVEQAVEEADKLTQIPPKKRLLHCTFKTSAPDTNKAKCVDEDGLKSAKMTNPKTVQMTKASSKVICTKVGKMGTAENKSKPAENKSKPAENKSKPEALQKHLNDSEKCHRIGRPPKAKQCWDPPKNLSNCVKIEQRPKDINIKHPVTNMAVVDEPIEEYQGSRSQAIADSTFTIANGDLENRAHGPSLAQSGTIPTKFDRAFQLCNVEYTLQNSASLVGRSKEEKLTLDMQMYMQNEKAFEHDVCRFMQDSGYPIRRLPFWQNVQVGLFQLFLAVYERGGFHKVSECTGGWLKVYRELSGVTMASSGSAAKSYYKKDQMAQTYFQTWMSFMAIYRNLFPYELYLKGQDYSSCFINRKVGRKTKLALDAQQDVNRASYTGDFDTADCHSLNKEPSAERETQELVQLLNDMDQQEHHLTWDWESPLNTEDAPTPGLDVTFYDESPPFHKAKFKEADLASDFKQANYPDESAQIIPQEEFPVSMTTDNSSDQVLHQMEILQQELLELHGGIVGSSG